MFVEHKMRIFTNLIIQKWCGELFLCDKLKKKKDYMLLHY